MNKYMNKRINGVSDSELRQYRASRKRTSRARVVQGERGLLMTDRVKELDPGVSDVGLNRVEIEKLKLQLFDSILPDFSERVAKSGYADYFRDASRIAALVQLELIMYSSSDSIKAEMVRDIYDRAGFKEVKRVESRNLNITSSIDFDKLSEDPKALDAYIEGKMKQISSKQKRGSK